MSGASLGAEWGNFWGALGTSVVGALANTIAGTAGGGTTPPVTSPAAAAAAAAAAAKPPGASTASTMWPILAVGGAGAVALVGIILLKRKKS